MAPKKKLRNDDARLRLGAIGLTPSQMREVVDILSEDQSKLESGRVALGFSKRQMRASLALLYDSIERVITVTTRGGRDLCVSFADPASLLEAVLTHNDDVYECFATAYDRFPCTADRPWRWVFGFDECWSGNPMAESGRKSMVLSFSFREFALLSLTIAASSSMWFTTCVLQASVLKDVDGQWSCIFAHIVRMAFVSEGGGFARAGVIIACRGRVFRLFARVANILADGDGFKQLLQWKGANGMKCCPVCDNVVSKPDVAKRSAHLCDLSCTTRSDFVLHDHSTLKALVQKVFKHKLDCLDGNISAESRDRFIMATGYDPSTNGIWADADVVDVLRVADTITLDWVHCAVSDGYLCHEIAWYIQDPATGATSEAFEAFCAIGWTYTSNSRRESPFKMLRRVIDEKSLSGHKRPSISDILSFLSVLYFWLGSHAQSDSRDALIKGIKVVFTIQHIKYHRCRDAGEIERRALELLAAYEEYMVATVLSNGGEWLIPKHHWMWHIASQYVASQGIMYDCLIVERLHRRVKKFSRRILNRSKFERSVLELVTAAHCFDGHLHDASYLGGRSKKAPSLDSARRLAPQCASAASDNCVIHGHMKLVTGDFVRKLGAGGFCGRVREAVELTSKHDIRVLIDVYEVVNATESSWNILQGVVGGCIAVTSFGGDSHWQHAAAWREMGSHVFTVLRPT